MNRYFEQFPTRFYTQFDKRYLCKDITRRVKIEDSQLNSPFIFYPYEISNNLRSDLVAEYYYDNSQMDWFIYLSNGIIDPYYGWYLTPEQLDTLIIQKYGSLEQAFKRILFYRNNWAIDQTEITPQYYLNTLPLSWKKYFSPNWGPNNKIISYSRKKQDSMTNTNRILQYSIANTSSFAFTSGEFVDIKIVGQDATVGVGEVILSNTSVLRIKNVSGNTTANSTVLKTIVGESSSANCLANSVSTIVENFSEDEGVFWSAISAYDYEIEQNEQKKQLRIMGREYAPSAINNIREKIQEDVDTFTGQSIS